MCRNRDSRATGPSMQWQHLRAIHPRHNIDSAAEYQHIQEEERDGCRRSGLAILTEQRRNHHHADGEGSTSPDHGPSSPNLVQSECWDEIADREHELDKAGD
jgi:hypothetical protein